MNSISKLFILLLIYSCANIIAPTGGDKDLEAPNLETIEITENMQHSNIKIISFRFDEFIIANNWEQEFYISPIIQEQVSKEINGKKLNLTIKNTLEENTTYNIALHKCIKDLNEGNILDTLNFIFSTSDIVDTLILSGFLKDSYSLEPIENAWIMLFDESISDSLIFKANPKYISKTDKKGNYHFPNLNSKNYRLFAITDYDFMYDHKEKIAFHNSSVNANKDTLITLLAFNPLIEIDSMSADADLSIIDSIQIDTLLINEDIYGKLTIISSKINSSIFQLIQKDKVIKEYNFINKPFVLTDIIPGKYKLKYIHDRDQDGKWTTGSWEKKLQPEKVTNYPSEITIRANWDLEIEWNLN